jgi:hypothetical protein
MKLLNLRGINWSGRVDLNHRPPGPEPGALARLSHAPSYLSHIVACILRCIAFRRNFAKIGTIGSNIGPK